MPFVDPPPSYAAVPGTYYIDYLSNLTDTPPNPDWGVNHYITTLPENLAADDTIGGVGNCSWEYTFSALDVEGNSVLVAEDFIHPWRSWWRLRCGSAVIAAGPVIATKTKLGDEFVTIVGQTWETYFTHWQYPFDPRPDHVNDYVFSNSLIGNEDLPGSGAPTPTGLAYQAQNRDVAKIAHDLLHATIYKVTNRMYMDISEFRTNPVGITTNYQYSLGDDSGIDSAINGLATVGEGFDYWIGWNKVAHIGSPYRFGSTQSPVIVYTIDINTPGLLSLEYENLGIQGNHVLGRGAGLASQTQMGAAYGYVPSEGEFSRLDVSFDYGDVRNHDQLASMTKKSLSVIINPVREVPITLDPAQITNYWEIFRKGRAIFITVDTRFHQINAPYRLKSWSLKDDRAGNFSVDLTLDRIYAIAADFGNPDDGSTGSFATGG